MRRAAPSLAALLLPCLALAGAPATAGYTSCRQRAEGGPAFEATQGRPAAAPRPAPTLEGDKQERDAFEEAVRRFSDEGKAYRGEVQTLVKKQFEERRRFLADHYEQAGLDGVVAASRDVIGRIAFRSFSAVRAQFYKLVLKADVGIVDVAWSRKRERLDRIQQLSQQKAGELETLDRDFKLVLREVD